jgi:hypothetical protein
MPAVAVVPTGNVSRTGLTLDGGAADSVDALDTPSDSKGLIGSGSVVVSGPYTIPSGGVVYRATVVAVASATTAGAAGILSITGVGSQSVSLLGSPPPLQSIEHTFTGLSSPGAGSGTLSFGYQTSGGGVHYIDVLAVGLRYNRAPTAPTALSPSNGSTVTGLVPTFQGTHNDPDAGDFFFPNEGAMNAVDIEVRRNSDNALMWASGFAAATGPTFSRAYAGTTLVSGTVYKWRARTRDASGTSNAEGAWSSYLTFTPRVNTTPVASLVSPAASASVGTLTPTLTIGFADADTDDIFSFYQIQVRRASDSVSFWDTGLTATTAGQKTAKQAAVLYAGTTLVSGTAYQFRARVQDAYGGVSAYTAWRTFTPNLVPNPPTLIGPTGLTNTLTPTISGSYNQGTGGTEAAFQYQVRESLTTIYSSGDVAVAIATGQAFGTDNAGDTPSTPPALAWGTSYSVRLRSKDNLGAYSDWTEWTAFNTNAAPTAASNVTPTNGAITPDTTPTITWQHNDPDGDAQTAADVELYDVTGAAFVSGYNPKTLTQATLAHDVTETLTLTRQYTVRVRTVGLAGPGAGPWSTPQTFTVADVPAVALAEPDPDDVITTSALTVEWTFSGGSGTQQDYRVRLYASDGVTVLHDSGVVAGTALAYVIPAGSIRNGGAYFVRANVRDTLSQEGVTDLVPFTASFTPPATVTGLTVTAVGDQT